jgi:hypothetical protein
MRPVQVEPRNLDPESSAWLRDLSATGTVRDEAVSRLHAALLRATRFEVARRRPMLPHLRGNDLDDIAHQAANDALMSVLARLDDFRGASRFTTWAYKFGLLEAAVKLRRRAWQGRELPLEPETWSVFSSPELEPGDEAERSELLATLQQAIQDDVELELTGRDADAAIPGLRAHLDGCPACREEHESLRALAGGERAL